MDHINDLPEFEDAEVMAVVHKNNDALSIIFASLAVLALSLLYVAIKSLGV